MIARLTGTLTDTAADHAVNDVAEYAARLVKKAVVGTGAAEKVQVHAMVQRLLPGITIAGPDAADALAVAITHAHHLASARILPGTGRGTVQRS